MIVTMTTGITLALTGSIMIATQTAQLIEILKSTDTSTRQQAEGVLEALGADAVEPLAQAMQSVDMGQAWRAARLLAKIDDPRRTLYMTRALASTNSLVGQVAVKVITTTLPADQCGACLVEHLRDCRPIVQVHMVTALATSHYYAAIDSLIAVSYTHLTLPTNREV